MQHFAGLGYPTPADVNVADMVLDLVIKSPVLIISLHARLYLCSCDGPCVARDSTLPVEPALLSLMLPVLHSSMISQP